MYFKLILKGTTKLKIKKEIIGSEQTYQRVQRLQNKPITATTTNNIERSHESFKKPEKQESRPEDSNRRSGGKGTFNSV